MDTILSMQNVLFKRPLEQEAQVHESLQKSPLHEGLQPKTPIGLEKNGDEVDGVQKFNAHVALNQT
jgi:hypothetical protein